MFTVQGSRAAARMRVMMNMTTAAAAAAHGISTD